MGCCCLLTAWLRDGVLVAVLCIPVAVAVSGVGVSIYYSQSSFAMTEQFKVDAAALAYIQAFGAVVGVITNMFIIDLLVNRAKMTDVSIIQLACLLYALTFFAFTFATDKTHLYMLVVPLGVASGLWYTVTTSMVSCAVLCCENRTPVCIRTADCTFVSCVCCFGCWLCLSARLRPLVCPVAPRLPGHEAGCQ